MVALCVSGPSQFYLYGNSSKRFLKKVSYSISEIVSIYWIPSFNILELMLKPKPSKKCILLCWFLWNLIKVIFSGTFDITLMFTLPCMMRRMVTEALLVSTGFSMVVIFIPVNLICEWFCASGFRNQFLSAFPLKDSFTGWGREQ